MGAMVGDSATRDVIAQINARFEDGDAIQEMVALQKEFKIFSRDHSLYDSWLLLNIKRSERAGAVEKMGRRLHEEKGFF